MVGPRTVWQSCGRAFESKELVYFVCLLCSVTDWSTRGERGLGVNSTQYQNSAAGSLVSYAACSWRTVSHILSWLPVVPRTAVTNYHKLGDSKQETFTLSQFRR